jgi:hypothetical protein
VDLRHQQLRATLAGGKWIVKKQSLEEKLGLTPSNPA